MERTRKIDGARWGVAPGDYVKVLFYPDPEWKRGIVQFDEEQCALYINTPDRGMFGGLEYAYAVEKIDEEPDEM